MKYSVLMAVYKNDNPIFLKSALESIFDKQTKKPDEIIVVFDGKLNDALYDVLNDFKIGKEITVSFCPQEENGGLGKALMIGSEKCTGNYIFRMDADDISSSARFERQIEYIESHPEIDVLGTDIIEFQKSPDERDTRIRSCPAKHEDIVRKSHRRNPMNHVSVCIKKEALKRGGGYKALPLAEDYYLWLRMIDVGCVFANINEPLVYVRVGNGFDSRRSDRALISSWKVLQTYMLCNGVISRFHACTNMFYIRSFVHLPSSMKCFFYDSFLRKKHISDKTE